MTLVIGDVSMNNAARVWTGDECCDTCGHYVCSCAKRGPCAPAAPPPAPVAGEARDPYEVAGHPWARVGMRVRCTKSAWIEVNTGETFAVITPDDGYRYESTVIWLRASNGCTDGYPVKYFEPAPSPAVEPADAFDHAAAVIAAHDREAVERARGAR